MTGPGLIVTNAPEWPWPRHTDQVRILPPSTASQKKSRMFVVLEVRAFLTWTAPGILPARPSARAERLAASTIRPDIPILEASVLASATGSA